MTNVTQITILSTTFKFIDTCLYRPLGTQHFKGLTAFKQQFWRRQRAHFFQEIRRELKISAIWVRHSPFFSDRQSNLWRGMTKPQWCLNEPLVSGVPSRSWSFLKSFEGPFHFLPVCHRGTLSAASKLIVKQLCLQPTATFLGPGYQSILGI